MSVHKFERPALDDEIIVALEQQDEAEKLLRFYREMKASIDAVRSAVGRHATTATLEMLDGQIERLQHDVEVAESMVTGWADVLEVLQSRAARP